MHDVRVVMSMASSPRTLHCQQGEPQQTEFLAGLCKQESGAAASLITVRSTVRWYHGNKLPSRKDSEARIRDYQTPEWPAELFNSVEPHHQPWPIHGRAANSPEPTSMTDPSQLAGPDVNKTAAYWKHSAILQRDNQIP